MSPSRGSRSCSSAGSSVSSGRGCRTRGWSCPRSLARKRVRDPGRRAARRRGRRGWACCSCSTPARRAAGSARARGRRRPRARRRSPPPRSGSAAGHPPRPRSRGSQLEPGQLPPAAAAGGATCPRGCLHVVAVDDVAGRSPSSGTSGSPSRGLARPRVVAPADVGPRAAEPSDAGAREVPTSARRGCRRPARRARRRPRAACAPPARGGRCSPRADLEGALVLPADAGAAST